MLKPEKGILIITSSTDATATYLSDKFMQLSIPFYRFDTENFPSKTTLHWEIHPESSAILRNDKQEIKLSRIGSVWYRRPSPPAISKEIVEPAAQDFARRECEDALAALWQKLNVLWVNHPTNIRYATRKPFQLQVARDLGFQIPETILSADQTQVKLFWKNHNGSVVFKSLHQDPIEVSGRNYFAYTKKLTAEHLPELERLTFAPTLFQEYIEPKLEIRVTVIGKQVFAASIDTSKSSGEPDWRRISSDDQKWQYHTLPHKLEQCCIALVQKFNLHFGALDLILTPQDEYYFLELNANGQWVWIEMITGMPMSTAMIELLSQNL
jgi:glutathione synthase/RimK-type ligase-like ATP-grasp enzyme